MCFSSLLCSLSLLRFRVRPITKVNSREKREEREEEEEEEKGRRKKRKEKKKAKLKRKIGSKLHLAISILDVIAASKNKAEDV